MELLTTINIVFEDNHLLVVEKPINIPVNNDMSNDLSFLDYIKQFIKERDDKPGNVFLGLVHRLDRPVGGLMVIAKTSKAASRLSQQIRQHQIQKTYLAVVNGKTSNTGSFKDFLLKDKNKNIVRVDKKGKEAILKYRTIAYIPGNSLVEIQLITGRSHQIRIQFAHHSHPLWGDQKYNKQAKKGQQIALFASEIAFFHPISKELLKFKLEPEVAPFNQFEY